MDRIQRSREEAARLRHQPVSEVTPSRRDFAQYVAAGKDEPAIIGRLSAAVPPTDREPLVRRAVALDDADVAAISFSLFDDLAAEDVREVSAAVTAPLLREDPLMDSNQLYQSRLLGVDAIVLPAAALDAGELARLVDVAVSMHMSVVVECRDAGHLDAAARWPYTIIGVADPIGGRTLTERLPSTRTVVLLSAVSTREEYDRARGAYDAVIAVDGSAILGGTQP